jgi:dihydrofolate reductase
LADDPEIGAAASTITGALRASPAIGSRPKRTDEFRRIERSEQVASRSTGGVSMRKVVLYELLSLDGVAEGPDKFVTDWDEAMEANLAAVIATQDAVVLGRRSYDDWSEFWPGSEIQPFATFINDVAKYVASSTPLGRQWHNATAIEGPLVQFVQDLKNSSGGDIGVHASISVAQALLASGTIDEVRLVVAPAIAGCGRRFWDGLPPIRLESLRSATSPRGYLLADYRIAR